MTFHFIVFTEAISQDRSWAWVGSSVSQITRMTRVKINTSIMGTMTRSTIHFTTLLQPGTRYIKECYGRRNYQNVQYSGTVRQELQ